MDKLNLDKKSLKKFGITMGVAFSIITILVFWKHRISPLPCGLIGLVFFLLGLVLPVSLKPIYIVWMRLVFVLGWINTRLILIVIFYLVFFPVGVALQVFGNDPLEQNIEKNKLSYWKKKEPQLPGRMRYERQF